jgi:predicted SnoaL-like aldol condensation-catalyzing enzyme
VTATTKKDRTVAIQRSLETGERFPLSYFDSRQYIQHNLAIGDGLGSLLAFLDQLPANSTRVRPIRAFEDGDISFAHLEYYLAPLGHVVGFEVHRWQDDRIVEHWDNLQPQPSGPNGSGRTMTDGPTESTDHERTQQNNRPRHLTTSRIHRRRRVHRAQPDVD